mmetsp:Transcript_967/g.2724  ORF Transcript_967/g.2724 Transcript_967/m.2724 type:complete len:92 (+) Transcript_967:366-641(+)
MHSDLSANRSPPFYTTTRHTCMNISGLKMTPTLQTLDSILDWMLANILNDAQQHSQVSLRFYPTLPQRQTPQYKKNDSQQNFECCQHDNLT